MNKKFKVIIAGSRDYNNLFDMCEFMDILLEHKVKEGYDISIISGCANGADTLGIYYAKSRKFKVIKKPADWDKYGKSAGPKRNAQMAGIADACAVFWDGKSRGSANMIEEAKKAKLKLKIIKDGEIHDG